MQNAKLEEALSRALRKVPDEAKGTAQDAAAIARIVVNHLGDAAPDTLLLASEMALSWKEPRDGQ